MRVVAGTENNECANKKAGGWELMGEGDLKNGQPTSRSKDKELLGEIKAGAIRRRRQQGSRYDTVGDR